MTVLGCTGHQNIPPDALDYVSGSIRTEIGKYDRCRLVGVCSLAVGADQLFARMILAYGAQLRVVIPCEKYDRTFSEVNRDGYHDLLSQAESVEVLDYPSPSEDAFLAAGRRVADLAEVLLAVWDGKGAHGKGGTGDVVAYARANGTRRCGLA